MRRPTLLLIATTVATPAAAQFEASNWQIEAAESRVEEYQGREALVLRNGTAWLRGTQFENGVIEFDVAVAEAQGFVGVMFRAADARNYEHYYIRPHMSGNPDATQYTPVFNGVTGWQIFVGERYTAPLRFRFDTWMRVTIIVEGSRAVAYVDGQEQEQLIPALVRSPGPGMIGLSASLMTGRFANVRVFPGATRPIPERMGEPLPAPPNAVAAWSVSSAIPEASLAEVLELGPGEVRGLTWTPATATERGIVNLAESGGIEGDRNTVFAALTLRSPTAQMARVRFGFSDRVRVFLNGRPLYAGADGWRSRDYRFLGTIGLFDELYLPLDAGANELWFAVSESFGGWGISAAVTAPSPLTVEPGCGRLSCAE